MSDDKMRKIKEKIIQSRKNRKKREKKRKREKNRKKEEITRKPRNFSHFVL